MNPNEKRPENQSNGTERENFTARLCNMIKEISMESIQIVKEKKKCFNEKRDKKYNVERSSTAEWCKEETVTFDDENCSINMKSQYDHTDRAIRMQDTFDIPDCCYKPSKKRITFE